MYDLLKEFIKPELLVLVPVLYLVGIALKRSAVADKHIPWILGAAGVVLSYLWIAGTCRMANAQEIVLAVFTGLVQGDPRRRRERVLQSDCETGGEGIGTKIAGGLRCPPCFLFPLVIITHSNGLCKNRLHNYILLDIKNIW